MAGIDDYKNSLEGIIGHYGGSNAIKSDGTVKGYQDEFSQYESYLKDLDDYNAAHSGDATFDATKFNLYRNHVNESMNNAKTAFNQAKASEVGAMSSKAQLDNMKEQAIKYAMNTVKAQGMGDTGASESAITGVANNYMNQVNAVDIAKGEEQASLFDSYRTSANAKEQALNDRQVEESNNAFQLAAEMMNNGSSYDKVIELYGNSLDARQKATLKESYSTAGGFENDWLKANTTDGQGFTNYDEMKESGVRLANSEYTISDVSDEVKELTKYYTSDRAEGDCVKLEHGSDSNKYIYMIYHNGKWYKTDASHYNSAANKGYFKKGSLVKGDSTGTFAK